MFQVKLYKDARGKQPIKEYLTELAYKSDKSSRIKLKKIDFYLEILRNYGTRAGEPYVKYIQDGIWELRPLSDRFFFFPWKDNIFILLHHIIKKTKKTPPHEIDVAKRIRDDFLKRSKDDGN